MISQIVFAAAGPLQDIKETFGVDGPKFFSQVILFVMVALFLRKFAVGPVQKILEERRHRIEEGLQSAEKAKTQLAAAAEERGKILSDAGTQAARIVEEARAAANSLGETERQKAMSDAANIIAKAQEAGKAEAERLKGELRKEF